jgi:hypothetical protein
MRIKLDLLQDLQIWTNIAQISHKKKSELFSTLSSFLISDLGPLQNFIKKTVMM